MAALGDWLLSQEAIDFQNNPRALEALAEAFTKAMEVPVRDGRQLDEAGLAKLVFDLTGMKVRFFVFESQSIDAFVLIPAMRNGHSWFPSPTPQKWASWEALKKLEEVGNMIEGEVNLKTGRVSGVFSEIDIDVFFATGWFKLNLTPMERVAILLHELGHPFTYLEYLNETTRTNYAMAAIKEGFAQSEDRTNRYKLVAQLEKTLNVTLADHNGLVTATDPGVVEVIVVTSVVDRVRSEMGNSTYDNFAMESLADQYASRMGAGAELASALVKISKAGFARSTASSALLFGYEYFATMYQVLPRMLVTMLAFSLSGPLAVATALGSLLYGKNDLGKYEDLPARLAAIERDMIGRLRKGNLPKSKVEQLVRDLRATRQIIDSTKTEETVVSRIVTFFSLRARSQRNAVSAQRELEKLGRSRLFVTAAEINLNLKVNN